MKNYKSSFRLIVPVLIVLLLLSACGAKSAMQKDAVKAEESYRADDKPGSPREGSGLAFEENLAAPEPGATARGPELPKNAKIIRSAEIDLLTKDYNKFTEDLKALVSSLNGYFEFEETRNHGSGRSGNFTVRVKSDKFEEFCSGAGKLAEVKSLSKNSEDVGEQYFDLESRLNTQKTKLERLQELLKKADKMEDVITLENAISDTERLIENMSGSLERYDSLINYSKINLYVSEIYTSSNRPAPELSFAERLSNAFSEGFKDFGDGMKDFAVYMAYNWLSWLLVIIILLLIFFAIRAIIRKFKAEKKQKKIEESVKLGDKEEEEEETPERENE